MPARDAYGVASEVGNARAGHGEGRGLCVDGYGQSGGIDFEGRRGQIAVEHEVASLITGDEAENAAARLVVTIQAGHGIAVCYLGSALLERDVADQISQGSGVGHDGTSHLYASTVFEQRGVDAATDVHPVAHHHGVTILLHGPLVIPVGKWVLGVGVREDLGGVVRQVVLSEQVDVNG